MKDRVLRVSRPAVAGACLLALCLASTAPATTVRLRVEGLTATVYEADVNTDGKTIHMQGDHRCDGTNNSAGNPAGATPTTALDDGTSPGGYTWEGDWFEGFEDFLVTRIAGDSQNALNHWTLAVNFDVTDVGGCQVRAYAGDETLWGYGGNLEHILELIAPKTAATGESFQVKVVDGNNGDSPVAGALVGGQGTDANGVASLTYDSPGDVRLKAEKADSLRSNAQVVCVYQPGSGQCGTGAGQAPAPGPVGSPDESPGGPGAAPPGPGAPETAASSGPFERTPPRARIRRPRNGARYRRGPKRIEGSVEESGSGVDQIYVRLTRSRRGRCTWYSAREGRFVGRTCRRAEYSRVGRGSPGLGSGVTWSLRLRRRLPPGSYVAQVRVRDRAGNADSAVARGRTRVRFAVSPRRRGR